jgi:3'-phosphoadenosine 5'-phosphosulfate sulfotransferase (PAPS reductase)/FAD synthetase
MTLPQMPTLFPLPPVAPPREAVEEARAILDEAVETHNPSHLFALMSGGHDSLCVAHLASQHPRFSGIVHVNTGIGIEETREFVRATCATYGWPLREMTPPVPKWAAPDTPTYDAYVIRYGFPGPAGHQMMYSRLKERCIRQLVREHKAGPKDRIGLVTGIRAQESARRKMGYIDPIDRRGAQLWINPILNWSTAQKEAYLEANALPRNRVSDLLCMSGECLCGAFAKPNELDEIGLWFPEAVERIKALEVKAAAAGKHCVWGTRPTREIACDPAQPMLGLCFSCEVKRSEAA